MWGRFLLVTGPLFTFDNFRIFGIIYLTRQPGDRLSLSVLANYNNFSKSPIRPRSRAAYLFFRFRIATIKLAVARITMNSSYVLISIILPVKTQDGWHARPPGCPGKYIILSRCGLCGGACAVFSFDKLFPTLYNILNKRTESWVKSSRRRE